MSANPCEAYFLCIISKKSSFKTCLLKLMFERDAMASEAIKLDMSFFKKLLLSITKEEVNRVS